MSSKPFDATLKELMEEYLTAWPAILGPWPVDDVTLVDSDLSTVTAAADKVLRIRGAGSDWLLDLEAQSSHELGVPARLHFYSAVLGQRHGLPVRSVLLLLRREANASDLTGIYQVRFVDETEP